ncbi:MAG: AtpZ/AtpI family protein [bacterium]
MLDDKKKLDWKPALQIFMQVSSWVIVPVILALIVGKALDAHFGTEPWIFLGLTGVAFIFSIYGIVRVVGRYMKTLEKEIKDEQK